MRRQDLAAAFESRGVTVEHHSGQTNIFFPNETKYNKCTVICQVKGEACICVVPEFEGALISALEDAEIEHVAFVNGAEHTGKPWKIRQTRVLLSENVSAAKLAAAVCQAAHSYYDDLSTPALLQRPLSAARSPVAVARSAIQIKAHAAPTGRGRFTALHKACRYGKPDEVRDLIAAGADLRKRTKRGDTPLHLAVFGVCGTATPEGYECARLLVAADRQLMDERDAEKGRTALEWCIHKTRPVEWAAEAQLSGAVTDQDEPAQVAMAPTEPGAETARRKRSRQDAAAASSSRQEAAGSSMSSTLTPVDPPLPPDPYEAIGLMTNYLSEHNLCLKCDKDLGPGRDRDLQTRTLQISKKGRGGGANPRFEELCEVDEAAIGTKLYSKLWHDVLHNYSKFTSERRMQPMTKVVVDAICRWADRQRQDCGGRAAATTQPPMTVIPAEPPDEFICPITTELMIDPVNAADGHTYERKAIEEWISRNPISPKTGAALEHVFLSSAHSMRSLINGWREKRESEAAGGR